MSIEESLERIAVAIEKIAEVRKGIAEVKQELEAAPKEDPKAEEPKEEPKEEKQDRESIKLALTNAGVGFNSRAATKKLADLLASVKSGMVAAAPEEALGPDVPAPEVEEKVEPPSFEAVKAALIEYVKVNGRDKGVAHLVTAGANKDAPKISQLDGVGRAKLMEAIRNG